MTNSKVCPVCECVFSDSSCVHMAGTGFTDDPYIPEPILNPSSVNLLECGPAGLAAFLPPYLLDPPCAAVYATINQTIAYDTAQILFFNAEWYDTDSMHDNQDDSDRITFNTAGIYTVTLNVRWKKITVDSGDTAVLIRKNGAEFIGSDCMPIADPDLYMSHSLTIEAGFMAGDYVEAMVKQDALVGTDAETGAQSLPVLANYRLPSFAAMFKRPLPTGTLS